MANILLLILNADSKEELLEAMATILAEVHAKTFDKTLEETLQVARDKKESDNEHKVWDADVAKEFGKVASALRSEKAEGEVLCESCEDAPATHYCAACDVALFCVACDMHGKVKKFRDHPVKTMAEYKVGVEGWGGQGAQGGFTCREDTVRRDAGGQNARARISLRRSSTQPLRWGHRLGEPGGVGEEERVRGREWTECECVNMRLTIPYPRCILPISACVFRWTH
jgi:hypothetical protein